MNRKLLVTCIKVLVLGSVLNLAGCGTPSFLTKERDETYQGKLTTLDVLLVPGNFPNQGEISSLDWYKKVGLRMDQNFRHNGVAISTQVVQPTSLPIASSLIKSAVNPTLILVADKAFVQNRIVLGLNIQASLLIPNRSKSIWEGSTSVAPFQAADDMSLKILNELANLKLVTLTQTPARTIDGKKSYTFGGVLAP